MVDVDEERAKEIGGEHGVSSYRSLRDLVDSGVVDAITIGVPSGSHAAVGMEAAGFGLHVLCEKPIDVSLQAADALIAACESNSVKLACVSQSRFEPDIAGTYEAVRNGRLGRMMMAEANTKWYRSQDYYDAGGWRGTWEHDGGGALINQSIHSNDVVQWIMGPVTRVSGFTATLGHDIEAEDTGIAVVQFESGALGVIQGATTLGKPRPRRHEFHGDAGTIILEENKAIVWDLDDGSVAPSSASGLAERGVATEDAAAVGHLGHKTQVEDLVLAIRENRAPAITGSDARRPLELILAIYESAKNGGAPTSLLLGG